MAFIELHYHSDALRMGVSVNVILPERAKTAIGIGTGSGESSNGYKTLYLFHGLSDDESIWMRRTSIERYASEYGIAVVMPSVARSWYTDTADGALYYTFVTEELPSVCRGFFKGMSDKREDNFVAGLSMGGYGAVKAALGCPERFGGCASLSGALDISSLSSLVYIPEWKGIFGFDFDDSKSLAGSCHDVFALAKKNRDSGARFPRLYMWCGTDDGLLGASRSFSKLLTELGVEHLYEESEGNHSWKWWDLHIQDAIKYLLSEA